MKTLYFASKTMMVIGTMSVPLFMLDFFANLPTWLYFAVLVAFETIFILIASYAKKRMSKTG